ncbi:unnamed protein product [Closterium sp. Naga37s-1]|nr:unnamed protein product [Closterium sp. Naga37s-1]
MPPLLTFPPFSNPLPAPPSQVAKQYLVLVVGLPPSTSFVAKQYLVLVVGLPPLDSFTIDAPIERDHDHDSPPSCPSFPSQVAKQYLVLVVGLPPSDSFTVDASIARDPDHEFARMVVGEEAGDGRRELGTEEAGERKGEGMVEEVGVGERRGEGVTEEQGEGMGESEMKVKESKIQAALTDFRVLARSEASGYDPSTTLHLSPPQSAFPCTPLHCVGESVGESEMKVRESKTQAAVTEFRVLARSEASGVSLLQAVPVTGRTHQIRVHLQHAKLPVLADHIYGALPLMWGWVGVGRLRRLECYTGKRYMHTR